MLLFICLIGFLGFVAEALIWEWGALYFIDVLLSSPENGVFALALFAIAMTLTRFLGDWLIEKTSLLRA